MIGNRTKGHALALTISTSNRGCASSSITRLAVAVNRRSHIIFGIAHPGGIFGSLAIGNTSKAMCCSKRMGTPVIVGNDNVTRGRIICASLAISTKKLTIKVPIRGGPS